MKLRLLSALITLGLVSGCASTTTSSAKPRPPSYIPPPPPPRGGVRPPMVPGVAGDRVIGSDARGLVQMFGAAQQDVREEGARKLQFANQFCVLDAYLYAPAKGKTPVVTYVTARTPDGRDAERNSCVLALQKR
jgi:hypothetical protein